MDLKDSLARRRPTMIPISLDFLRLDSLRLAMVVHEQAVAATTAQLHYSNGPSL